MKEKNEETPKGGFIQIPILIAILLGVILVGGVGYVGVKQYRNSQTGKNQQETKKEIIMPDSNKVTSTSDLSEVEKLRKEVDQLKKQQADSNNQISPTQNVQKATGQTTATQNENFSSAVTSAMLSQAKSYQDLVDSADGTIQYIDISLDELATLIATNEGYVSVLGPKNSEISQSLINLYQEDVSYSNAYIAEINSYRETAKIDALSYKNAALDITSKFVDMQEFISTIETLKNDKNWNFIKNKLFETYKNYNTYRKNKDNFYIKTDAQLRVLYSQMTSSQAPAIPTYQTQVTPQIQMPQLPKTTSCTLSGDGGVGLQAYINCVSY